MALCVGASVRHNLATQYSWLARDPSCFTCDLPRIMSHVPASAAGALIQLSITTTTHLEQPRPPTTHQTRRDQNILDTAHGANMEEERLWKFRRPEWLNNAWARGAGVYAAGAIVRPSSRPSSRAGFRQLRLMHVNRKRKDRTDALRLPLVLHRLLRNARRRRVVQVT